MVTAFPVKITTSGCVSLDDAYQCGNEININAHPADPDIANLQQRSQQEGIVLKQTTPGAGTLAGYDYVAAFKDASIVASGFSLTPDALESFSFTSIGPGVIALQGSGIPGLHASRLIIQTGSGPFSGAFAVLAAQGVFGVVSAGSLLLRQSGADGVVLLENAGDGQGKGGQVKINAFAGSGQLQYRMGPHGHEAWNWKPSYSLFGGPSNDGFFPIPHSGQIVNMIVDILERYGLVPVDPEC